MTTSRLCRSVAILILLSMPTVVGLAGAADATFRFSARTASCANEADSTLRSAKRLQSSAAATLSGIINNYARILSYDAAANIATIDTALWFSCSDLVLVIQMNGARYDTTNDPFFGYIRDYRGAGSFEFVRVTSITPTTVSFTPRLQRSYDFSAAVQLVTVPQHSNALVTGTVRAGVWNGWKGGIIALVADTLRLDADIDAGVRGFTGGNPSLNIPHNSVPDYRQDPATGKGGYKGGGVAIVPSNWNCARGAAGSGGGGGNGHNSGGAGGGNGGTGGRGGFQHNGAGGGDFGGMGGRALDFGTALLPRAFLGGGGGGGHQNDNKGTGGATGGGIVFVSAKVLDGNTHSIIAKGASQTVVAGNDGGGGGGAGGTICFAADTVLSQVFLSVPGGKGGDVNNANNTTQCHGPGGGGAGGAIWHAGALLPPLVSAVLTGGVSGMNVTYPSPCLNTPDGALNGASGILRHDLTLPRFDPAARGLTVQIADTMVLCPDSCAWLRATVGGGRRPFRFSWTPVDPKYAADSVVRVCPPGTTTYTLSVTDSSGCTGRARVTVVVSPRVPIALRRGCDSLFVEGLSKGDPCRWYKDGVLIPGDTGLAIPLRGTGTYMVTALTSARCPVTAALAVVLAPMKAQLPDTIDVCEDSCIVVSALLTGGVPPYRYVWTPARLFSAPWDATPLLCPDSNEQCTLTVTDKCGDTATARFTIRISPRPALTVVRNGDTLIALPGGLLYQWYRDGIPLPGATGQRLITSQTGVYTVEGRTGIGCAATVQIEIADRFFILARTEHPVVCADSCTRLHVDVSGGVPPLRYLWTPSARLSSATVPSPLACPDSTTTYAVTVTDSAGKRLTAYVTVSVQPKPSLTILRNGDTLIVWPAGLQYQWYREGLAIAGATGQRLIARLPGTYSVTARTPAGCPASADIAVPAFPFLVTLPDSQRVCPDSCVKLHPTITRGVAPFQFTWSPGASLSSPSDSTPVACPDSTTTYTLVVTDSLGMRSSASVTVTVSPRIHPVILRNGDTLIAVPPGVAVQWYRDGAPVPGGTNGRLVATDSGRYTVQAWSSDGCPEFSPPVDIVFPALFIAPPRLHTVCPDSCVTLLLGASGGTPPLRYAWTPSYRLSSSTDSTPVACPDSSTTYTLTVTDARGRMVTSTVVVIVSPRMQARILRSGDTLIAQPAGAAYEWSRDGIVLAQERGQRLLAPDSGLYVVRIMTTAGCPIVSPPVDIAFTPLQVFIPGVPPVCPDSCVRLRANAGGGFPPYTFAWSPQDRCLTPTDSATLACPDSTMVFTLLITDARGRMTSAATTVTVFPRLSPRIVRNGDTLTAQPAGCAWRWFRDGAELAGENGQTLIARTSGHYTVEVRSADNCPALSPGVDVTLLPPLVTAALECPPRLLVEAGERVTLLARIALPSGFASTGIDGATLWMHARASVLAPAMPQDVSVTRDASTDWMRATRAVTAPAAMELLVPLDFIAMLGDTACTRIVLDSLTWRGGDARVVFASDFCEVCVRICGEGGQRLFDGNARASLAQNHPNPFNASTVVAYTLIERGPARLAAFDRLGREVAVLDEGLREPGEYRAVFDGTSLPSGVYAVLLITPTMRMQRTMVLMK